MLEKLAGLFLLCCCVLFPFAGRNPTALLHAAPATNPRALPISPCSEKARLATLHFWEVFSSNDYAHVDDVIAQLTAAYGENPRDAIVTRLLGLSHTWKFFERGRCHLAAADVQDHAVLAVQFLQKAQDLCPHRLIPGFVDGIKATLGVLQGDKALFEESLQAVRNDARADPNFHGFSQGFVFSALLSEKDCRYPEALEGYFANIEGCSGIPVPRRFPRAGPMIYSWLAARAARKDPICYNNDVAPHNIEGLMLGLGDAFLKQGKVPQARMAYNSAKRSPNYASWPYKDHIETRLTNLEVLRDKFRAETANMDVGEPALFFQSSFSCTACHAR